MTWFQDFRGGSGFTFYGEQRTPVTVDVPLVAVVYSCILISIATLIATAGIRGRERWYTLLRVIYSLAVGSAILLCIFGYCWQETNSRVTGPYIYRSGESMRGEVGVRIALRRVNITLTGSFQGSSGHVAYNEEIEFEGVSAPRSELRKQLMRGLPDPVISVVEYLSTDTGGLRWGRGFNQAGYFANILLWTAFSFWIVANIMLSSVVFYGAALFTLTGVTMVLAAITYHVLQPTVQPRILCSDHEFHLKYGSCFWATLVIGIVTTIIGIGIVIGDYKIPKTVATFFLIDTQTVIEDSSEDPIKMKKSVSLPCSSKQATQLSARRNSAPSVWHVNKGYLDFGETNIPNPVYEETEEDNSLDSSDITVDTMLPTGSDKDSAKHTKTAFQIGDVDVVVGETLKRVEEPDRGAVEVVVGETLKHVEEPDRLQHIYVDIESSKTQVLNTFKS